MNAQTPGAIRRAENSKPWPSPLVTALTPGEAGTPEVSALESSHQMDISCRRGTPQKRYHEMRVLAESLERERDALRGAVLRHKAGNIEAAIKHFESMDGATSVDWINGILLAQTVRDYEINRASLKAKEQGQ